MGHSYKVRSTRIASAKLHLKFSHGCSSEKENLGLTIQAAFSPAWCSRHSRLDLFRVLLSKGKKKNHLILLPIAYN